MGVPAEVRYISLCSGVGGLDLGIHLALPGARCLAYVEREAYCIECLVSRMQEGSLPDAPVWSDLATFEARPFLGHADMVIGGIPCQPASTAGKRGGEKDDRWLWEESMRIVGECRPKVVFFENVAGLFARDLLDAFREGIVGRLEGMGYRCAAGVFSAEEVGAGHGRDRVFVIGYSSAVGNADVSRLQGGVGFRQAREEGRSRIEHGRHPVKHGCILPLFPPGPDDIDSWMGILSGRPNLAPAVRRRDEEAVARLRGMAHGPSARVDRLRATGNCVVPLCGAVAFCTLADSLVQRG